jgi:hypothetical protein
MPGTLLSPTQYSVRSVMDLFYIGGACASSLSHLTKFRLEMQAVWPGYCWFKHHTMACAPQAESMRKENYHGSCRREN